MGNCAAITATTGDERCQSALLHACRMDKVDIVRLCIGRNGADIDKIDQQNRTPLIWACWHNNVEMARLLLEHGADIDKADQNGWTPLLFTCFRTNLDMTYLFLQNGATSDKADRNGKTPLFWACHWKALETIRLLIEHGADLNREDEDGVTPLNAADQRSYGNEDNRIAIVEELIRNITRHRWGK